MKTKKTKKTKKTGAQLVNEMYSADEDGLVNKLTEFLLARYGDVISSVHFHTDSVPDNLHIQIKINFASGLVGDQIRLAPLVKDRMVIVSRG